MEETFFLTLTTNSFYCLSYLLLPIWWAHNRGWYLLVRRIHYIHEIHQYICYLVNYAWVQTRIQPFPFKWHGFPNDFDHAPKSQLPLCIAKMYNFIYIYIYIYIFWKALLPLARFNIDFIFFFLFFFG